MTRILTAATAAFFLLAVPALAAHCPADAKAIELGFQPDRCERQIFQEPRPGDLPFLDEEGITERRDLWAVYYYPHSRTMEDGGRGRGGWRPDDIRGCAKRSDCCGVAG